MPRFLKRNELPIVTRSIHKISTNADTPNATNPIIFLVFTSNKPFHIVIMNNHLQENRMQKSRLSGFYVIAVDFKHFAYACDDNVCTSFSDGGHFSVLGNGNDFLVA